MRFVLLLGLVLGCHRDSTPTDEWCRTYAEALRSHAAQEAASLTQDSVTIRRRAAEQLREMVGTDPAIQVARDVCSAAHGDSPDRQQARSVRLNNLTHRIANALVLEDSDFKIDRARANELVGVFSQLADTYDHPEVPK